MKYAFGLLSALPLAASAVVHSRQVNYDGYKVVRVESSEEVKNFIQKNNLGTWNGPVKDTGVTDVVIPAGMTELDSVTKTVMHEDLGAAIASESQFDVYAVGSANSTWFNSYHAYADHLQFLRDLVASFPSNAEIVTAGNSGQGRPITGIHFYGSGGKGTKPAIVLHGTVHAREWITTMVVEYFAFNLLSNYASNAEIQGFVNKYDFYVFPVVNPDGFVYTQTNDRLWRKNRQTLAGNSCVGRDINRNWPYKWQGPGGASTNPCAEDYKGQAAGDAPETPVLYNYINRLASSSQGLKLYIDYHSYSQLFMTPYGYSCTVVAPNNSRLQSLATGAVNAIRAVYGTVFEAGPICSTIYQVSGGSVDYVNDVSKGQYVFTSELRDTGNNGFVLPANQIAPSGVEAYAGFAYLLRNI